MWYLYPYKIYALLLNVVGYSHKPIPTTNAIKLPTSQTSPQ